MLQRSFGALATHESEDLMLEQSTLSISGTPGIYIIPAKTPDSIKQKEDALVSCSSIIWQQSQGLFF